MEHLLAIPTNRPLERSMDDLFHELTFLRDQGWDVGFLLLDSCPDEEANLPYLQEVGQVPCWHLTWSRIERFCHDLRPDLMPTVGVANFGKVANLCGLVAVALGAKTLTRRDADEFLVSREGPTPYWYPTERDLQLLKERSDLVAAGTAHFGDCDSDIEGIYQAGGPNLMAELGAFLGLELDFADPAVKQALQHPRPEPYEDWTRFNEEAVLYPGTSTVRSLYELFPVPPVDETPDVDNLYLNLMARCGWSRAAHGRLLAHRHPTDRKASPTSYWVRMAAAVDYTLVTGSWWTSLGTPRPTEVRQRLLEALGTETHLQLHHQRAEHLESFCDLLARLPGGQEASALVRPAIKEQLERLDRGLERFRQLLEDWPRLVRLAFAAKGSAIS